ncbi:Endo-1,4-beta-xylanase F1 [Morella rubra]|uniref:Endo-1,4-beta-xylanase F1 n=1 Tax=Morella rubra TaxID=262757 RepID=A0A6A1V8J8_9ROSI|nr:Endo-1,4-beta-xylanase F1 [Morella rubra]
MGCTRAFLLLACFIVTGLSFVSPYVGPLYDYTAYTECKTHPEEPLYKGGILKNQPASVQSSIGVSASWVKIQGAESALIRASLKAQDATYNCVGTVLAKRGCWSFLKGGFVLSSPSNVSILYLQSSDNRDINIAIASASLQPFTQKQWVANQQYVTNRNQLSFPYLRAESSVSQKRKRAVTIHVSDGHGERLPRAAITIQQVSKEFPFGSAIAKTILGNLQYQNWFVKRFNTAVFENELKWYATEPEQGQVNYNIADQMLEFIRANQIVARGHNIFWEDPKYTPAWVRNLTGPELQSAVNSRIRSLMSKYREEFIHWDVSNEMLHFDFYEQRLGPNATLLFYEIAHESDPLATLFMNEFNVVETCSDEKSTVDTYISRLRELISGGVSMDGIGLEGHFSIPNLPLMRAIVDKLATLGLPIWLTEVDISNTLDQEHQAIYLEQVLREGFSHPSVNGIMLWTALHPNGCYQMCLTDNNFQNLPAGDVVDKLLKEWQTGEVEGETDEHGSYSFYGFLGQYRVSVEYGKRSANSTLSLSRGDETKHYNIQL